jgi:hypothetical protein
MEVLTWNPVRATLGRSPRLEHKPPLDLPPALLRVRKVPRKACVVLLTLALGPCLTQALNAPLGNQHVVECLLFGAGFHATVIDDRSEMHSRWAYRRHWGLRRVPCGPGMDKGRKRRCTAPPSARSSS